MLTVCNNHCKLIMCWVNSRPLLSIALTLSCIFYSVKTIDLQNFNDVNLRNLRQSDKCGPLKSLLSEEYPCYIKGNPVECPKSTDIGAVITKRCRPYYKKDGVVHASYICQKGGWFPITRSCQPECGWKKTKATVLIIGGEETDEHEYPWFAGLYYENNNICGGTIISPFHVLTAAQCLTDNAGQLKNLTGYEIVAGKHYRSLNVTEDSTQIKQIKSVAVHSGYRGRFQSYRNDIAVVEIEGAFKLSALVQPACIDWNSTYETSDFLDGNKGTIVGWGFTEVGSNLSEVLRKIDVPYWSRGTCLKDLPQQFAREYFTYGQFCAGFINKRISVCSGDSGGGLYFKSDGERYFVRGIAALSTRTDEGCDPNHYALYTTVSSYLPWLRAQIEMNKELTFDFRTVNADTTDLDNYGCILPKHVDFGKFSLSSGLEYIQDTLVKPSTAIVLSCGDDDSQDFFFCLRNRWSPSVEKAKCRKPGACSPLYPSVSEEVICKLEGKPVSCLEPENNTIAIIRCQPFYIYKENRPIYKCQNGKWDYRYTPCTAECGAKRVGVSELIIGGGEALNNEYPWVVAIYNGTNQLICSGSIISRFYVLSAAHCFSDKHGKPKNKTEYTIGAGKHYRDLTTAEPAAQIRKVESLFVHENYKGNRQKYRDDIALVKLDKELTLTLEVQPICIDYDSTFEDFDFIDGIEGVVAGWGYTEGNGSASNTLKKVLIPYRSRRTCAEDLPLDFVEEYFTSDKFCAGYSNNNTNVCQGDSGGGLYFKSDSRNYYIRGVVSIAPKFKGQCNPNQYALYTKVSKYLPWIEGITQRIL